MKKITLEFDAHSELATIVTHCLEEHKAQSICTLDVQALSSWTDTFIICTATSSRHAKALAEHLIQTLKAKRVQPLGVEGIKIGDWILIEWPSLVVHIMLKDTREFYQLETLWSSSSTTSINDIVVLSE